VITVSEDKTSKNKKRNTFR